jgi:hypothetical protein
MLVVDLMGNNAVVVSWPDDNGRVYEREYPNQCVYPIAECEIQSSI